MAQSVEDISDEEARNDFKCDLNLSELSPCPPFVIMNPSHIVRGKDNKNSLGRHYQWGFADCLNDEITDFNRLHKLILNPCKGDLIEITKRKAD